MKLEMKDSDWFITIREMALSSFSLAILSFSAIQTAVQRNFCIYLLTRDSFDVTKENAKMTTSKELNLARKSLVASLGDNAKV